MEQHVEGDPCKFVLACRGSSERLTLQAANIDIKQEWVQSIRELLDMQSNFLTGRRLHLISLRTRSVHEVVHIKLYFMDNILFPLKVLCGL